MLKRWSGDRVTRLVRAVLDAKGRTCWLCRLPGADSADHNPARQILILAGVPDVDAMRYLFPAHRLCNVRRGARPVTDELRAELRRRRLDDIGSTTTTAATSPRFFERRSASGEASSEISPRFARKRPEVT